MRVAAVTVPPVPTDVAAVGVRLIPAVGGHIDAPALRLPRRPARRVAPSPAGRAVVAGFRIPRVCVASIAAYVCEGLESAARPTSKAHTHTGIVVALLATAAVGVDVAAAHVLRVARGGVPAVVPPARRSRPRLLLRLGCRGALVVPAVRVVELWKLAAGLQARTRLERNGEQ